MASAWRSSRACPFSQPEMPDLGFKIPAGNGIGPVPRGGIPIKGRGQHKHRIEQTDNSMTKSAVDEITLERPPERMNQKVEPTDPGAAFEHSLCFDLHVS